MRIKELTFLLASDHFFTSVTENEEEGVQIVDVCRDNENFERWEAKEDLDWH